jgi:hypothetical protein
MSDLDEIVLLKSRYCHYVDTKDFAALDEILLEEVTVSYQDGAISLKGLAKVQGFLTSVMTDRGIATLHLVANPEIEISGDVAVGRWALTDTVINVSEGTVLRGAAHYDDRYVRTPAGWRIAHTGYRRLFEQRAKLGADEVQLSASPGT